MRISLPTFLVVTLVMPVFAQNLTTLDDPIREDVRIDNPRFLPPCAGGMAVDQIARAAHVLVGFENTEDCAPGPRSLKAGAGSESISGMSARLAFDRWIVSRPMYSWKPLNGMVVFRPTTAWANADNVLNQTVQPFRVTNEHVDDILHTALRAATPSLFIPHEDVPRRSTLASHSMTVAFAGGTLLDALNAIVLAHGGAEWEVGYTGNRAHIVVSTVGFPKDSVMAPTALPQSHRYR